MATINSIFGKLSGRVGDVVFKQLNGKTYVTRAPRCRETPFSDVEKAHHNKFAYVSKISSAINHNPLFKSIWKKTYPPKVSPFQKISKHIHKGINEDLSGIQLTPSYGIHLINPQVTFDNSQLTITTDNLSGMPGKVKKICAAGIVIMTGIDKSFYPDIRIAEFQSAAKEIKINKPASFSVSLSDLDTAIIQKASSLTILISYIIIKNDSDPENYSRTFETKLTRTGKVWK